MNLHTTLKAYNEVVPVSKEQQRILKEAQSIIDNSEQKDLAILDMLGMNDNLKAYEKISYENEQASKFDEIYDISVIRKMAIHYGLRFLPSKMYKGTIDPLLPSVMNRFCEKHDILVNKQFYILAPSTSFRLEERPKDPIIFYKINENKYALIHKWGNDLNNGRLFTNFFVRSINHICLTFSIVYILAVCALYSVTGQGPTFIMLTGLMFNGLIATADSNSETWDSKHI